MCVRPSSSPLRSFTAAITDALDAAEAVPCGAGCTAVHVVSWTEHGRTHCEFIETRRPLSLGAELRACGYRRPDAPLAPRFWPAPSSENPKQSNREAHR